MLGKNGIWCYKNYICMFVCLLNDSKWILSNRSCHPEHAACVTCKLLSGDTQIHSLSLNLSSYGELCDIHYRNEQVCQQFGTQYMHEWCKMFLLRRFSTTASCHHICKHRKKTFSFLSCLPTDSMSVTATLSCFMRKSLGIVLTLTSLP